MPSPLPQDKLSPAGGRYLLVIMATLICLVMGIGMVSQGFYEGYRDRSSLQWPKVTGQLIQCDKVFHSDGIHFENTYSLSAAYTYAVNNQHYTGNQLALWSSDLIGNTGSFAETHAVPCSVDVYYDPQNPENAILIPGPNAAGNHSFICGGSVFLIVGIAMALMLRPAYARYKKEQPKPLALKASSSTRSINSFINFVFHGRCAADPSSLIPAPHWKSP